MNRFDEQASYGISRTRQVYKLIGQVGRAQLLRRKDLGAKVLFEGLYDLGGVYIKFLQALVTLMPDHPAISAEMRSKVFDQVGGPAEDIHAELLAELGPEYTNYIKNVDLNPIASGSFATVYGAEHADGTKIVIKILRPNLSRQLKTDMKLLRMLAKTAQPLLRSDLINLSKTYAEFNKTVWEEINYPAEAANAYELSVMYNNDRELIIPRVYDYLVTDRVLVQERLYGIALSELLAKSLKGDSAINFVNSQLGSDLIKQMQTLGSRLMLASLKGPYLHGDPHPGNVILLPDNKVGLIDFGVKLAHVKAPNALLDIMRSDYSVAQGKEIDVVEHITRVFKLFNAPVFTAIEKLSLEIKARGGDLDLLKEIRNVVEKIAEPSLPQLKQQAKEYCGLPPFIILESINKDNQFGISANEKTARIVRTLSLFWTTTTALGIKHEVALVALGEVMRQLEADETSLMDDIKQPTYGQALEIMNEWMSELVQRNPLMFGELFGTIRQKLHNKVALHEELPDNA